MGLGGHAAVNAQMPPAPANVLQLSASATAEVQQDLLTLLLAATREGPDAQAVQAQLKTLLDAALTQARAAAVPGQLDVRTGNFSLFPRHGKDGRISAWQGTAELVLEGRDFARISQLAGRITGLNLAGVSFDLSREQRARAEAQVQQEAIERFKAQAAELARGFGFGGYSLREVAVSASEPGFVPRPRMMALEARAAAAGDAPVPVAPGRAQVGVTVSGTVQLR